MCGMTRAQICDPEMANKAREDRPDDIRACIGCNQACIGHFHLGYSISCIQHPETGRELAYGSVKPAAKKKKVLVAGGGLFQTREDFPGMPSLTSNEGAFTAGGGVRVAAGDRITVGVDVRMGWEPHIRVNGALGIRLN